MMTELLDKTFFQNSLQDFFIAAGIIIIGLCLIRIFRSVFLNRMKAWVRNTQTDLDDFVIDGIDRFVLPGLYFGSLYLGLNYLTFSPGAEKVLRVAITAVIVYLLLRLVSSTVLLLLQTYVCKQERGEEKVKQLGGLMLIINIVFWMIGLIFLFDNMGYDVTTVITGLGIGGIAVALAAQNILGDLFNYFVIFFDRPFEIGDFIIIDDKMGVVDYIGVKTTRIKSLTG